MQSHWFVFESLPSPLRPLGSTSCTMFVSSSPSSRVVAPDAPVSPGAGLGTFSLVLAFAMVFCVEDPHHRAGVGAE